MEFLELYLVSLFTRLKINLISTKRHINSAWFVNKKNFWNPSNYARNNFFHLLLPQFVVWDNKESNKISPLWVPGLTWIIMRFAFYYYFRFLYHCIILCRSALSLVLNYSHYSCNYIIIILFFNKLLSQLKLLTVKLKNKAD